MFVDGEQVLFSRGDAVAGFGGGLARSIELLVDSGSPAIDRVDLNLCGGELLARRVSLRLSRGDVLGSRIDRRSRVVDVLLDVDDSAVEGCGPVVDRFDLFVGGLSVFLDVEDASVEDRHPVVHREDLLTVDLDLRRKTIDSFV